MAYHFQKASRKDIPSILEIADTHYYTFGTGGFLISKYDYNLISSKMTNPNSNLFVTKNDDGEVLSFMILTKIFHNLTMNGLPLDTFFFKNEEDKKLVTNMNHWHMEQGAVRKDMLHKGVGSFYYQQMFDMFPDHSFSSNVVNKPVENRASIKIKYKFDFRAAGEFQSGEYKALKNFGMAMFIREPQDTFKNKKP